MASGAGASAPVKLLIDEMWPPTVAGELRRRRFDAVAVLERTDLRGASDLELLGIGRSENRVIVTENASDFRRIAAREMTYGRGHAGLILTSNHRFPRSQPKTVGLLVTALVALLSSNLDLTDTEHWLV